MWALVRMAKVGLFLRAGDVRVQPSKDKGEEHFSKGIASAKALGSEQAWWFREQQGGQCVWCEQDRFWQVL